MTSKHNLGEIGNALDILQHHWWVRKGAHCTLKSPDPAWYNKDFPDVDITPRVPPVFGVPYTVSGWRNHSDGELGIILLELDSPDVSFGAGAFRPLTSQEEDIWLFQHLDPPSLTDRLDIIADGLDIIRKTEKV